MELPFSVSPSIYLIVYGRSFWTNLARRFVVLKLRTSSPWMQVMVGSNISDTIRYSPLTTQQQFDFNFEDILLFTCFLHHIMKGTELGFELSLTRTALINIHIISKFHFMACCRYPFFTFGHLTHIISNSLKYVFIFTEYSTTTLHKAFWLIAGSLESANSSILAACRLFKEVVGKKIRILC